MRKKIIVIADAFYPNVIPPEAVVNTRLAKELSSIHFVQVYAGSESKEGNELGDIKIVPVKSYGVLLLAKIVALALFGGFTNIVLMYDASGFNKQSSITYLPFLLKISRPKLKVAVHFTNGCPVPAGWVASKILHVLRVLGICGNSDRLGMLACSEKLVFYCGRHMREMTNGDARLLNKSVVHPVPPTIFPDIVDDLKILGWRDSHTKNPEEAIVVFFGLIYPEKGIDTLLSAMSRLQEEVTPFRLLIIGGAGLIENRPLWNERVLKHCNYLKGLVEKLNLQDVVEWIDYMEESELSMVLRACDLVVFPFRKGVMANNSSFAVAIHHGANIVATFTEYTDEFLLNADVFKAVPPDSPDQLSDAIVTALQSNRSSDQIDRQLGFANKYYSWDGFVNALVD